MIERPAPLFVNVCCVSVPLPVSVLLSDLPFFYTPSPTPLLLLLVLSNHLDATASHLFMSMSPYIRRIHVSVLALGTPREMRLCFVQALWQGQKLSHLLVLWCPSHVAPHGRREGVVWLGLWGVH